MYRPVNKRLGGALGILPLHGVADVTAVSSETPMSLQMLS